MRRVLPRIWLAFGSLVLALALAEGLARLLLPNSREPYYYSYYEDRNREPTDYQKQLTAGWLRPWPGGFRERSEFAPGFDFYICYKHSTAPWVDSRGCVQIHINSLGIRDRDEITWEKPPGQKRIVCLGDSFTLGLGVRVEKVWTRLIENDLKSLGNWTSINCGVADGLYIDEYWMRFRERFHRLDPDVVLVTICLNDIALIPHTIAMHRSPIQLRPFGVDLRSWSRLVDRLAGAYDSATLVSLDPGIDYGAALLRQVDLDANALQYYRTTTGQDPAAVWPSGAPQKALRELRDWCAERGVALRIVVWPLLQGLRDDEVYPFQALHDVVREFCATERIPSLDLLPVFRGHDARRLWVDPCDAHPNEPANALASPHIARFLVESGAVKRD